MIVIMRFVWKWWKNIVEKPHIPIQSHSARQTVKVEVHVYNTGIVTGGYCNYVA